MRVFLVGGSKYNILLSALTTDIKNIQYCMSIYFPHFHIVVVVANIHPHHITEFGSNYFTDSIAEI